MFEHLSKCNLGNSLCLRWASPKTERPSASISSPPSTPRLVSWQGMSAAMVLVPQDFYEELGGA